MLPHYCVGQEGGACAAGFAAGDATKATDAVEEFADEKENGAADAACELNENGGCEGACAANENVG